MVQNQVAATETHHGWLKWCWGLRAQESSGCPEGLSLWGAKSTGSEISKTQVQILSLLAPQFLDWANYQVLWASVSHFCHCQKRSVLTLSEMPEINVCLNFSSCLMDINLLSLVTILVTISLTSMGDLDISPTRSTPKLYRSEGGSIWAWSGKNMDRVWKWRDGGGHSTQNE